jgi:hypothetical protein
MFPVFFFACNPHNFVVLRGFNGKHKVVSVDKDIVHIMSPACEEYYPRPFFESGEFNENHDKLDSTRYFWRYEDRDRTEIQKGQKIFEDVVSQDNRDSIFYNNYDCFSTRNWFRYLGDTIIHLENCTRTGILFEVYEAKSLSVPAIDVCKDCLIGKYVLDKISYLPLLIDIKTDEIFYFTYATHFFEDKNFKKKIERDSQEYFINDSLSIHWDFGDSGISR